MSKIICEVCGTSYPETSAQCPICGCVRPGDVQGLSDALDEGAASGGYTYVKGGRFSKKNVRKRNSGAQVATAASKKKAEEESGKKKSNKGLIITIAVLILAIIAVVAYIVIKFVLPGLPAASDPADIPADPGNSVVENVLVPCEEILLDTDELVLEEEGQTAALHVNLFPANTTDTLSFTSADETVAVVSQDGVITAVAEGETSITLSCGNVSVNCEVRCEIIDQAALNFRLNRQQITFDKAGSGWQLYSGEIAVEDILWTTDDASVATISDGKVISVGEGYTTVYGEYKGVKQGCEIVCAFSDGENAGHEGNGGVTEDGSQNTPSGSEEYHLDNLFSQYDTEVTIGVGEWFPLQLVDSNGNKVDADWSVQDSSICTVSDGEVTAVASGQTYVIATYNGQEYRCLVRVA